MNITKHIPNLFTLVNAFCGALAVVFLMQDNVNIACYLVLVAAICDFFDGFVARAFHASSELGKQLDSLSDVISFGVVPALLAHYIYMQSPEANNYPLWVAYIPMIIVPLSAYRLGKFNLDTRQSTSFLGLPTPANGLFWVALALVYTHYYSVTSASLTDRLGSHICRLLEVPWVVPAASVVLSLMLVSEIPLFAMKFKGFIWKGNEIKFIFVAVSLLLLAVLQLVAAPFIFLLYITLSLIQNLIDHRP